MTHPSDPDLDRVSTITSPLLPYSYSSGELAGAATMWGLQLVDAPLWYTYESMGCSDLDLNGYTMPDACFSLLNEVGGWIDNIPHISYNLNTHITISRNISSYASFIHHSKYH
jgi:hypothetical protein